MTLRTCNNSYLQKQKTRTADRPDARCSAKNQSPQTSTVMDATQSEKISKIKRLMEIAHWGTTRKANQAFYYHHTT